MLAFTYRKLFFLTFLLATLPLLSNAQVVINEVQLSPTGERFIELRNQGSEGVDLTGWFIQRKTASGSAFNSLVSQTHFEGKSIDGNGFFLITRNVGSNWDIYLDNLTLTESNTLLLKNGSGSAGEVDKVGWGSANDCQSPCPSNPPEGQSIQRTSTGWVTSTPTPRQVNAQIDSGTSNESNTSTTTTSNTSSTSSGNVSAHYSSTPLSSKAPETSLKIGAGRERLGSVGSPLEFKAEGVSGVTRDVRWNFGDGSEGYGETVVHTYEFPGEYVVVVSTQNNSTQAVSRVNVKIIDADLVVTNADPAKISIKNNSTHEINMYGRALWAEERTFLFSEDTIIRAGQEISFSSRITGLYPQAATSVQILVVGDTENAKISTKIEEEKSEKISEIKREIASLSQALSLAYTQQTSHSSSVSNLENKEVKTEELKVIETEEIEAVSQAASVLDALPTMANSEGNYGWWSSLKKFFLRTNEE